MPEQWSSTDRSLRLYIYFFEPAIWWVYFLCPFFDSVSAKIGLTNISWIYRTDKGRTSIHRILPCSVNNNKSQAAFAAWLSLFYGNHQTGWSLYNARNLNTRNCAIAPAAGRSPSRSVPPFRQTETCGTGRAPVCWFPWWTAGYDRHHCFGSTR